jgi:ribosome-binding protein aMBF1 (putative translation factor)
MSLPQLRRVRWAVRATLLLGVAASVAANILHAEPNPVSQVIAAWPPLALLLTVELISRVPVHRRSLAVVRLAATTTIAGIAAWVSYWHMAGVASRYGETGASPYLLPLSVDGLVIVASVSLVELAGRIRQTETAMVEAAEAARSVAEAAQAARSMAASARHDVVTTARERAPDALVGTDGATLITRGAAAGTPPTGTAVEKPTTGAAADTSPTGTAAGTAPKSAARKTTKATPVKRTTAKTAPAKRAAAKKAAPARTRRPVTETAALAARLEADQPHLSPEDIAERLGITTQYLRRIKREVPVPEAPDSQVPEAMAA